MRPSIAWMGRRLGVLGVLALASRPAQAAAGGVTFDFPAGAIGASYEISDWDPFSPNDPLDSGTVDIPDGARPGDSVTVGLGKLTCNGKGKVAGPNGSSGEGVAELMIEVTWTFPGGAQWVETKERRYACPQPVSPS